MKNLQKQIEKINDIVYNSKYSLYETSIQIDKILYIAEENVYNLITRGEEKIKNQIQNELYKLEMKTINIDRANKKSTTLAMTIDNIKMVLGKYILFIR